MIQKPGHLQFDDSAPQPVTHRAPAPIDFGQAAPEAGTQPPREQSTRHNATHREPAPLFSDGGIAIAPAMAHARSAFPELAQSEERSIEARLRQLLPWKHEIVSTWGGKVLDENAAITTSAAQLINRFSDYAINELAEKATAVARRGESNLLTRLFLRNQLISYKPALTVAKAQLMQLLKDCGDHLVSVAPINLQLRINLVALIAAYDGLAKPAENAVDATINARRVLLQQAIYQAELTESQLQELKQQMAALLTTVEQLLTITIPAFEIADAAK